MVPFSFIFLGAQRKQKIWDEPFIIFEDMGAFPADLS